MTTKREMLHTLLDSILDIEESSKKGVRFQYSNSMLSFYFMENDSNSVSLGASSYIFFREENGPQFVSAIEALEKMRNTPDAEPMVKIAMTEEKARELGLIA